MGRIKGSDDYQVRLMALETKLKKGSGIFERALDKEDFAMLKEAFHPGYINTSLAGALVDRVVQDLDWSLPRRFLSGIFRIFSGGGSLPYALLQLMPEEQVDCVVSKLYQKLNAINLQSNPEERMEALERLKEQVHFLEHARGGKVVSFLSSALVKSVEVTICAQIKSRYDAIWKKYPAQQVNCVVPGSFKKMHMASVFNGDRDAELIKLARECSELLDRRWLSNELRVHCIKLAQAINGSVESRKKESIGR